MARAWLMVLLAGHIERAWEWVRLREARQAPDITEIHKKAKEGDAKALSTMGDAYHLVKVVCHRVIP